MAGYSKLYCIGSEGGFMGLDGINTMWLQIWVGDSSRQWLEARYFDAPIRPMGKVATIIPEGPDHPDSLLDACIAFFPEYFKECLSLEKVKEQVKDKDRLDFDLNEGIPDGWGQLREEAREIFKHMPVYQAILVPVEK